MNEVIQSIADSIGLIVPEVVLLATACVVLFGAGFWTKRTLWAGVSLGGLGLAMLIWWFYPAAPTGLPSASLFRAGELTWFVKGVGLVSGIALTLLSWNQIRDRHAGEYFGCLLLITAGVNLVAASNDLVSVFLALELISIPTYILLYLPHFDASSQEATTKYFLLSVFSSAILLYGFSFLYGTTGSTNLEVIRTVLRSADPVTLPGTLGIALVMIVAGLGFKITAAPFHFYAPDVYQGAPTVGAALLSFVPKIAGFFALFQIVTVTMLAVTGEEMLRQASGLIWIVAMVSMFLGNLLALLQDNLKRLLAYSGVAHAGYMLVGLGAGYATQTEINGIGAMFFYLVIYGAMTLGAFAVIAYLSRPERSVETLDDLAGLGKSHPFVALLMTIFLFSLTGLPPTAGFTAKLYIFLAAWSTGSWLYQFLAILMAINAAIGGWYYLRIIGAMYLRSPVKPLEQPREVPGFVTIALCALLTLGLFIAPGMLNRRVTEATKQLAQDHIETPVLALDR